MGYYTSHQLYVKGIKSKDDFDALLRFMMENQLIYYAFDQGYYYTDKHEAYFGSWDSVKWYTHENDMIAVSKEFPEMTFKLEGHGEDFDDIWVEYYKQDVVETCQAEVVIPDPVIVQWKDEAIWID